MAMMLRPPKGGSWLSVNEIVTRLQSEFKRVQVAPGGAAEYAANLAASYRKAGQGALADRIEAAKDEGAAIGILEEDPGHSFVLMVLSEFPIMAGFASEKSLQAIQPLLERCSRVLGYELR